MSFADAFYFCCITFSLIGFGDVVPSNDASRVVTVVYILMCLVTIAAIVTRSIGYGLEQFAKGLATAGGIKDNQRLAIKLSVPIGAVVVAFAISCVVFRVTDSDLSAAQCIYAAVVQLSAVGYGDIAFDTPLQRVLGGLWSLFSTFLCVWALSWIVQEIVLHRRASRIRRLVTVSEFEQADRDGNKALSKYEFVLFKLKDAAGIDERTIIKIEEEFEKQADYLASLESKADEMALEKEKGNMY